MPYIKKADRDKFESFINELQHCIETPGELNYVITRLALGLIIRENLSYENINSVIGALSCSSQEIYRRVAAPYEGLKIEQNTDVQEYAELSRMIERLCWKQKGENDKI